MSATVYGKCRNCHLQESLMEWPQSFPNVHANGNTDDIFSAWPEALEEKMRACISTDKNWGLDIVRNQLVGTAMEQLTEVAEEEWSQQVLVHFVGEPGADAGGPRREFFTLFFKCTDIFDGDFFRVSAEYLHGDLYKLLGKLVAYAVLCGHTGPRRLHPTVAAYILSKNEALPKLEDMEVQDAGIKCLMQKV